ncbi:MAG: MFS transporter [Pseudomonadota bacterium]
MSRSLTIAILPLAAYETLIWAGLFYSFPALLPIWEADLGWSRGEISGALTASMIVTALMSLRMGTLIDRGHARTMLRTATVIGAVCLVVLSQVETLWQFWAIWVVIGIVNACVLYEACFAIITVTVGARAKQGIAVVTLVAGFAGTVSFPAFHFLTEAFGWRGAVLTFAGVTILACLPLAELGLRQIERFREPAEDAVDAVPVTRAEVLARPAFWWIAIGFSAVGLVHGMVISHIRTILADAGVALAMTVIVASTIGPMQVFGRLVMLSLQRWIDTYGAAIGAFFGVILGLTALLSSDFLPILAFAFVVPYGASYGVFSIVRPVLAAEFLGRTGFGTIAGMLALPYVLSGAIGPILAAALWSLAGYDLVLGLSIGLIAMAFFALSSARRASRR